MPELLFLVVQIMTLSHDLRVDDTRAAGTSCLLVN